MNHFVGRAILGPSMEQSHQGDWEISTSGGGSKTLISVRFSPNQADFAPTAYRLFTVSRMLF